jgi:hypothetical protein
MTSDDVRDMVLCVQAGTDVYGGYVTSDGIVSASNAYAASHSTPTFSKSPQKVSLMLSVVDDVVDVVVEDDVDAADRNVRCRM